MLHMLHVTTEMISVYTEQTEHTEAVTNLGMDPGFRCSALDMRLSCKIPGTQVRSSGRLQKIYGKSAGNHGMDWKN